MNGERQDKLMTVREVAAYLQVHPESVRRWCREGRIPFYRVFGSYRFRLSKIDRWVDGKKGTPGCRCTFHNEVKRFDCFSGTGGSDGEAEGE